MQRIELADTLIALIDAIAPPVSTNLFVTEALLEMPMEVTGGVEGEALVFFAAPPHTRWISGVLPAVHRTLIRVELTDSGGGEP